MDEWFIPLVALTACVCFVCGTCARLELIRSTRRDQRAVIEERLSSRDDEDIEAHRHIPPQALANDVTDDDETEYSEGFDADQIAEATRQADDEHRRIQADVDKRRAVNTLRSVASNRSLVDAMVALAGNRSQTTPSPPVAPTAPIATSVSRQRIIDMLRASSNNVNKKQS